MENETVVAGLFVYPVKSMKGIALSEAALTPLGLEHDRRWMVVREDGKFVTQRDNSRLALVRVRLQSTGALLEVPNHGSIEVPFDHRGGLTVSTNLWGDECDVQEIGEEVSSWLTAALESRHKLGLARMAPAFIRPQNHPEMLGADTHTLFADAAPYLIANEASLEALNHELSQRDLDRVPMNRFRPNIVLTGLEAWEEHRVKSLIGSRFKFELRAPCERCVVTTIDQATGARDPEKQPFRTLVDINPVPGKPRSPAFAQYATLREGVGNRIAVGDRMQLGD